MHPIDLADTHCSMSMHKHSAGLLHVPDRDLQRVHTRVGNIEKYVRWKMPPKLKGKLQNKKKMKKQKESGLMEDNYKKANLEVHVLQDHLALQRQVMRQAQHRKQEMRGKLHELLEDLQEEKDTKQAIYSEMTRQHKDLEQQSSSRIQDLEEEVAKLKLQLSISQEAMQTLKEESEHMTQEKEAEITELKREVENMEAEYETMLHSCLDQLLPKLSLVDQKWTSESLSIHHQYKQMLQDCGLNPFDI
ncbi:PREDICTED: coiled-coil domain-containing protein 153 [Nanorana parkeri]|uniref:coiled-coil domain-containing protein 153 n=1 Tax=Nanorana parkeri TaxID=125878 RepID=UPI000854A15D|nr:PREDICTED: coiled-coil domain-containing protein 153 [Nanorana parkeri]